MMREVFPELNWISAHPTPNGIQVRVWTVGTETERDDLAIPLAESGTGIAQALAILFVLLTSDATIMIVDEPTSFLHPGASRSLMRIVASFNNSHQFVIATHSPETISILRPDSVLLLSKNALQTHIDCITGGNLSDVQSVLSEIGAKLSDVFSFDNIVWVEGATEEICFPMLIRHSLAERAETWTILSLYNTGDLETRRASGEAMWTIYQRLSAPSPFMPRVLAFSLDREGRTESEIQDLLRRSGGLVRFLPRRTYENFLIHPAAISAVLNEQPAFAQSPTTETAVRDWIENEGARNLFIKPDAGCSPFAEQWMREVNAPKLLSSLFSTFSEAREEYRKTEHSVRLTSWILGNEPSYLSEIQAYVQNLVRTGLGDGVAAVR